ncbi:MAG: hypothetical protein MJ116_06870 [Lachnospiraceae bacterium]|nr:hypothetical protein [Lachnospiraceae bacterium]
MKKLSIIAAFAIAVTICLTGCGPKDKGMVDPEAEIIENPTDISGTWVSPGRDFEMEFNSDGTFTDKEKLSKTEGTYQFMSQNAAFVIGDQFDEVHYISCQDEKGKAFYSGAVLGDLISGYNEVQRREWYYVKKGRAEVPGEELLGHWKDCNGKTYYVEFGDDGSLKTTDWDGTYEITQDEEVGTTAVFHFSKYDEEYAVVRYEKYLFLYRIGTSGVYQLVKENE